MKIFKERVNLPAGNLLATFKVNSMRLGSQEKRKQTQIAQKAP